MQKSEGRKDLSEAMIRERKQDEKEEEVEIKMECKEISRNQSLLHILRSPNLVEECLHSPSNVPNQTHRSSYRRE